MIISSLMGIGKSRYDVLMVPPRDGIAFIVEGFVCFFNDMFVNEGIIDELEVGG